MLLLLLTLAWPPLPFLQAAFNHTHLTLAGPVLQLLYPAPLHSDGLKTLWPANPYCIRKDLGLKDLEGEEENLLSVFLGGQTAGWVLKVSPSLTQLSVRRAGGMK